MINARLRTPLSKVEPMPITDYLDRVSARPGDTLVAHVSTRAAAYEAHLVRVISGNPSPAGPGTRLTDHSSS